ncbi:hypothetical protein G6O69_19685 [Pseudenhygromyxa sp. WMMC2535]|uniref:hypothetical protein n=1 Tax=Pseudenhygromyxa sp. WMMC2535 TaxID=2712867 RepID=UPI001551961D|nr:hypothetical protein [Pseudenhygromyxa sp. WMMC2535]NVB40077.1 hypothetical protein [Pseudenhygromyxa sp. WMMC2535]
MHRSPRLLLLAATLALSACSTPADDGGDDGTGTGTETDAEDTDTDTDGACNPTGTYAECGAAGTAACMADGQPLVCLVSAEAGTCSRECEDACDCWAAPEANADSATVDCLALVEGDPVKSCVLACAGGLACPSPMTCDEGLGFCVHD